ncbi:MAG: hypothetical protein F6K42_14670 [Leptolyngbya sp. SIO1D8]|nr:hypothetical protein [Leptolyngbya sp. SIO1D8]
MSILKESISALIDIWNYMGKSKAELANFLDRVVEEADSLTNILKEAERGNADVEEAAKHVMNASTSGHYGVLREFKNQCERLSLSNSTIPGLGRITIPGSGYVKRQKLLGLLVVKIGAILHEYELAKDSVSIPLEDIFKALINLLLGLGEEIDLPGIHKLSRWFKGQRLRRSINNLEEQVGELRAVAITFRQLGEVS